MQIVLTPLDDIARRYGNALGALGRDGARTAMMRALNHEGDKGRTKVRRALARQMRLPYGLMVRAVVATRAWTGEGGSLEYVLRSKGGPISLKYYRGRETRAGAKSRAPGMEGPFPKGFIRGGRWPRKGNPPAFGGHVMERVGASRLPLRKLKGPAIPDEMVKGESVAAWETVPPALERRVGHEIFRLLR